jgi:hypothetical protein
MIHNISRFEIERAKIFAEVLLTHDDETGISYVTIRENKKKTVEAFRNYDTARLYYAQIFMRNIR